MDTPSDTASDTDFDGPTWAQLRQRTSVKWRKHPADVLPMFIAEMDVPLAAPVAVALHRMVVDGDTGYAEPSLLPAAFAAFATRRWGWTPEVSHCFPVPDVMSGVGEALRVLTPPGSGVVICPPVYHPFFVVPAEVGRVTVPVPLGPDGGLDLPGIDAALAAGARAVLMSHPHNPTGRVWTSDELDALDALAASHGAVVLCDEIHAPLTLSGAGFTPYLAAGERHGVTLVSASKAFNLAGLKSALVVAGSERVATELQAMPEATPYHCGIAGVLASVAAFTEGEPWLDALLTHLESNRALLGQLLTEQLPQVGYEPPQAGYLAWLDTRALGPEPARRLLEVGRVALTDGVEFGAPGFSRLTFATPSGLLREAVTRMASVLASS
ncbi:MAG: aminotransferase class I/II-fold pyridoxal phosphate-dependent enzyme [Mycobacteriaceae bacterium]